jgi:hypothetical protein
LLDIVCVIEVPAMAPSLPPLMLPTFVGHLWCELVPVRKPVANRV